MSYMGFIGHLSSAFTNAKATCSDLFRQPYAKISMCDILCLHSKKASTVQSLQWIIARNPSLALDSFSIPNLTRHLIARPDLWARLHARAKVPLILACAPGGYGKTTTLAAWLRQQSSSPVAWCSLDRLDNSLERFVLRLITCVQAIHTGACDGTLQMLEGQLEATPGSLAHQFREDLTALPDHLYLALDDYHLLDDPAIHSFVQQILYHAASIYPEQPLTLVILSRHELPFPVARLRSQRRILELKTQDLRMNVQESEQMLAGLMDLPMSPTQAVLLQEITEGWAAGINLLALSLRNQTDLETHLRGLHSRPTRDMVEYFMEEVLADQPGEVGAFLQVTSILPTLDPDLCAAAWGNTEGEKAWNLLEHVVRNNLFVVPVNHEQNRFRYHDLFKAVLQERLRRSISGAQMAALYKRVAEWHSQAGDLARAIEAFLAGDAPDAATSLLASHVADLQNREEWRLLHQLLDYLPPDRVAQDPALLLARGWIYQFYGQPTRLQGLLNQVTALLTSPPPHLSESLLARYQAEADLLALCPSLSLSSAQILAERTQTALRLLPPEAQYVRGKAQLFLARQMQMHGQLEQALALLAEEERHLPERSLAAEARLLCARASALLYEGRTTATIEASTLYVGMAQQLNLPYMLTDAHFVAGLACYTASQPEQALHHLQQVMDRPYQADEWAMVISTLLTMKLCANTGDGARMEQAAAAYRSLAMKMSTAEILHYAQVVDAALVIFSGHAESARPWLEALAIEQVSLFFPYDGWLWGYGQLGLPDLRLSDPANTGLRRLAEGCQAIYCKPLAIEFLGQLARIHAARQEWVQGMIALEEALTLGFEDGCIRPLLEADPTLDALIEYGLTNPRTAPTQGRMLLQLRQMRYHSSTAQPGATSPQFPDAAVPFPLPPDNLPSLKDPLTEREMDVLHLLAARRTRQEIAQRLNISPHTVKNHISRIYAKLGSRSSRDAVQQARLLGLLSP